MVIMCFSLVSLIWSTIAAKVVDFPLPVGPVININPFSLSASLLRIGGTDNSSTDLISVGIVLKTASVLFLASDNSIFVVACVHRCENCPVRPQMSRSCPIPTSLTFWHRQRVARARHQRASVGCIAEFEAGTAGFAAITPYRQGRDGTRSPRL